MHNKQVRYLKKWPFRTEIYT